MEQYFPPGRTDLVLSPLEHISHQESLDKMLKDRDEVAVLGAVLSRFNTHSEFNSSLIFMRKTYELFSRESMQTGRTDHRKFGVTSPPGHIFSRKSDPNDCVFDQDQARTMADHFASDPV